MKLTYDEPLSHFAFNFKLRRYNMRLADMGCLVKFFCPRWLLCVMVGTAPTVERCRLTPG